MHAIFKGTLAALGVAALAGVGIGAEPALAQFGGGPPPPPNTGIPIGAELVGGNDEGRFGGVIDPPKGTLCYILNVGGLEGGTVAHIHRGAAGTNGPPLITLETPTDGASGGCTPVAADLAAEVLANPAGFYVNVHTQEIPTGAIRGQLKR